MKKLFTLTLAALCLCASPARAEDLIAPDAIVPETANYNRNAYSTGALLGSSGFDAKQ